VECKMTNNHDGKSKILPQLLSYASHVKFSWSKEYLYDYTLHWTYEGDKQKLEECFRELNSDFDSVDGLYEEAAVNLKNGNLRLVMLFEEQPRNRLLVTYDYVNSIIDKENGLSFLLFLCSETNGKIKSIEKPEYDEPQELTHSPSLYFQADFRKQLDEIGSGDEFDAWRKRICELGLTERFHGGHFVKYMYRNHVLLYLSIYEPEFFVESYYSMDDGGFKHRIQSTDMPESVFEEIEEHIEARKHEIDAQLARNKG